MVHAGKTGGEASTVISGLIGGSQSSSCAAETQVWLPSGKTIWNPSWAAAELGLQAE